MAATTKRNDNSKSVQTAVEMTISELRAEAARLSIAGRSRMARAALVTAIESARADFARLDATRPAKKSAAKPAAIVELSKSEKAAATHAATLAEGNGRAKLRKCSGACGERKPLTSFPTRDAAADGTIARGEECRACRDERRAAAKAAAAKPTRKRAAK